MESVGDAGDGHHAQDPGTLFQTVGDVEDAQPTLDQRTPPHVFCLLQWEGAARAACALWFPLDILTFISALVYLPSSDCGLYPVLCGTIAGSVVDLILHGGLFLAIWDILDHRVSCLSVLVAVWHAVLIPPLCYLLINFVYGYSTRLLIPWTFGLIFIHVKMVVVFACTAHAQRSAIRQR